MNYPSQPGVYWFLNNQGKVIYVGKAKNLNNRLKSYALINQSSPKTAAMLRERKTTKFKITESEFEALLLEAELIKTYQPGFNILLKDDRSKLYLNFTKETFPRIILTRKSGEFGPYPSSRQLTQILKILRQIFPYCDHPAGSEPAGKACFYYHLQLCPGACINKISPADYQKNINNLKLILKNKKSVLLRRLSQQLKQASIKQNFEQAAVFRDQINHLKNLPRVKLKPPSVLPILTTDIFHERIIHLRRLLKKFFSLPGRYPLTRIEAYDISNLQGTDPAGSLVVFINAQPAADQYRHFKIKSLTTPNDLKMLKELLTRRVQHQEWGIPNLILIDGGANQVKTALTAVPWNIPIIGLAKHPDRLICLNQQGTSLLVIKYPLPEHNPGTFLLQHLRDESHRFARRLHHHLCLSAYKEHPCRRSINRE